MDEAVVESDGGDPLSLSHTKKAACSSRSSRSASVKAAGADNIKLHVQIFCDNYHVIHCMKKIIRPSMMFSTV